MTTFAEEVRGAAEELGRAGVDSPRLDAELLLAHVLKTDRAGLVLRAGEEASPDVRTRYLALLVRRVRHEPIAYILGRRGFRNLDLVVDPRVLIPRPETELLVEVGLGLPRGVRVVDVGTGSGAIALALKQERPDLHVVGLDVSAGALSVARMNAQRLRLDVEWVEGDLLGSIECDAVLANLPYIRADAELPADVIEFEPRGALFSGGDGLDLIRGLVGQVAGRSRVRTIALEIGFDQGAKVLELLTAAGFTEVECVRDLAGLDRVVVGRR